MIVYEARIDVKVRSSELLAALMKSNGYSVRDLAERVGAHRATIGHLRSGKRAYVDEEVAHKIAKALRVTTPTIFDSKVSTVYREVPGTKGKAA